ncbi:MAG: hypothetical protein M3O70_08760 [Actinomycetota bacterium]|nr:hypothetical protein [Actinomycetota bacterium]
MSELSIEPGEVYSVQDKSGWGAGPWQEEPDKVVWVDATTDLDCMIVRHPHLGHWCGYVGVAPEHPWHGISYDGCLEDRSCTDQWECEHTSPERNVRVHGGVTFAGGCRDDEDPATSICHVPQPGRPTDVWWFGFDCAHAGDLAPKVAATMGYPPFPDERYRTQAYVVGETERLAKQLADVTSGNGGFS